MLDQNQRRLLGEFVRAHRERLTPDQPAGRRRTPGLRREELAERAGISATWCAWLEQGRDVRASPQAIARLSSALRLTRAERAYLFELAGRHDPDAEAHEERTAAPSSLWAIVDALDAPAYGLDRFWNACCWNSAAEKLFAAWLQGDGERNLLRFVFLNPAARQLISAWEERARRLLAEFRADYSHHFNEPVMAGLLDELRRQSPLFAVVWKEHHVMGREGGLRSFCHPDQGFLTYEQHTFRPSDAPDYKLVFLRPV